MPAAVSPASKAGQAKAQPGPKPAAAKPVTAKPPKGVPVGSTEYQEMARGLYATVSLSHASKVIYTGQLRRLELITQQPVGWSLAHPQQAWAVLQKHVSPTTKKPLSKQSLKSFSNALTAALKLLPGVKERYPEAQEQWRQIMSDVTTEVNAKYEEQKPSDRQEEQHVPWAELVRARERLLQAPGGAGSMPALVMALHTMIPPLRADFGAVRVYRPPKTPPPAPGSAAELATPNFLVLRAPPPRTGEPATAQLVLTEYKTAARYGRLQLDLPPELVAVVQASLAARPRDWLVTTPKGNPFSTGNTYSFYVRTVLKDAVGKESGGVNAFRHSFAIMLHDLDPTPAVRAALAREMAHSAEQNERYHLRLAGRTGEASAGRCRLQCEIKCDSGSSSENDAGSEPRRALKGGGAAVGGSQGGRGGADTLAQTKWRLFSAKAHGGKA